MEVLISIVVIFAAFKFFKLVKIVFRVFRLVNRRISTNWESEEQLPVIVVDEEASRGMQDLSLIILFVTLSKDLCYICQYSIHHLILLY